MDFLSLVLGLGAGAGALRALDFLREYRTEPAGLADLLGWGFLVEDGVVLLKDGALMTGWRFRGPDASTMSAEELDVLSCSVSEAFRPYGEGWMFHVDAVRRPATAYAPAGHFPDPVTRLIDEERRQAYTSGRTCFETDYTLVATYLPPPEFYSRLGRLFLKGDRAGTVDWDAVLSDYLSAATELQARLAGRLWMDRLDSDALVTHLHVCLTGLHHPVRAPADGAYLNYVLADQQLLGGFRPRIGRHHIRVVAVQAYPDASFPGVLDFLNGPGYGFRASSRIIPLSYQTAARHIRKAQLAWFNKRKGALALVRSMIGGKPSERTRQETEDDLLFVNQHARKMAEDAQRAASENASGLVRFAAFTSLVVIMEPTADRADFVASEILKGLSDRGFTARIEDVNALEAYLGSQPGHGYQNLRKPLLSGLNVADLLPTTAVWPGLAHNPSPFFPPGSPPLLWARTAGTTPFRVNLHDGDVGHTLVIGATGAGKSTLVGMLVSQWFRYEGAQVFLFDVGRSGYLLARAAGARHYDIAGARPDVIRFQPLANIDRPEEEAWAAEWLETLMSLQGLEITPVHRKRLSRALQLVAASPPEHRTLTELMVQLQSREMKDALRPYTVAGPFGHLLDAREDGLREGAFQVFEMKHLVELSDRILVPVLLYLFHRIEHLLSAGRPTLIVIEEAWAALMRSLFAGRIKQWLLTLRKENAALVLVAHSPAQLAGLEHRQLITESCPTRIFLPNPEALDPASLALYAALGLSRAEAGILARARKKQDYYFSSPRGSRLFELGPGPVAMSFLSALPGKSMQETIREAEALMAEHGANWVSAWLTLRGLDARAGELDRPRDSQPGGYDDEDARQAFDLQENR